MACQGEAIERVTIPCSMHVEERPPGATRLHRYDWSPKSSLFFGLHGKRQLFYRWPGKERSKRKLLAKNLLYAIDQASGKQRVPAPIEKVVSNPYRPHIYQ